MQRLGLGIMPLNVRSSTGQKARDRIVIAVKRAKRTGATLAVGIETARIFARYPECPFSKEEIEAELIQMALHDDVSLLIG
jgi:hypothetical protein